MRLPQNITESLTEKISNERLHYPCSVLIGDNSSGKSFLIKRLIEQWMPQRPVYFIDAVNRGFDVGKVTAVKENVSYANSKVVETRLKEDYFNLQDSFNCYGTSTERIEQIYSAFEEQVQQLFAELTQKRFKIIYGDPLGEVQFEGERGTLSSGYQALIRILLELIYYNELSKHGDQTQKPYVVIDEVDEFLSPRYAAKILGFLRSHFSHMEFIVSTQSIDLVVAARDANIVVLYQNEYEVLDANDYNAYSEVQLIFERVFGSGEVDFTQVEKEFRRLLNNKINHAWSDADDDRMKELGEQDLSASQQLIYRQILKW